jgi:hypothetical protein
VKCFPFPLVAGTLLALQTLFHSYGRRAQFKDQRMSQREANILYLRDLLEHLTARQRQLEWADDNQTIGQLAEAMQLDLERCLRICATLQRRCAAAVA